LGSVLGIGAGPHAPRADAQLAAVVLLYQVQRRAARLLVE
jgi:hypothetical protein